MYFGGIWGGQLQRWRTGTFNAEQPESPFAFLPDDKEPALCAKVARLTDNLAEFAEDAKDVVILDENNEPLLQGDTDRRFLRQAGCINTMANIIFLIQQEIRITYAMPLAITLMAHLPMQVKF